MSLLRKAHSGNRIAFNLAAETCWTTQLNDWSENQPQVVGNPQIDDSFGQKFGTTYALSTRNSRIVFRPLIPVCSRELENGSYLLGNGEARLLPSSNLCIQPAKPGRRRRHQPIRSSFPFRSCQYTEYF